MENPDKPPFQPGDYVVCLDNTVFPTGTRAVIDKVDWMKYKEKWGVSLVGESDPYPGWFAERFELDSFLTAVSHAP